MNSRRPLEGLIVVDFSWALAGPWFTKVLAEHGATVIRIESSKRLDVNRRGPPYKDGIPGINRTAHWTYLNNDKFDITLDLKHPRAIELAKKLVAKGDVVVENFTPGTIEKFGLGYQELIKVKPSIIMLSLSAQGQTGPHSRYSGYGWLLQALCGLQYVAGFPDKSPVNAPGPQITDYLGSYAAIIAVMAALDYRRRTGKGQYIDLSETEGAAYLQGQFILDYTVNGREAQPMANRHPSAAPHGIYRCKGDDRWCAFGIFTDREWQGFVQVIGAPDWTGDSRFATLRDRKRNEDELEKLVDAWCTSYTAEHIMVMLQARGIAAGVVQNIKDVFEDPQLKWRGHYQALEHLEMGRHHYETPGFKLSKTPCQLRRAAPLLGQDNEYIYKEFLGLSEQEYVDLLLAGVFE